MSDFFGSGIELSNSRVRISEDTQYRVRSMSELSRRYSHRSKAHELPGIAEAAAVGLDADVLVVSRSLRETHVRCDQDDKP